LLARLIRDHDAWEFHHEETTRALAELPASVISRGLQALEAVAHTEEVQARHTTGLFVELFSRAAAWEAAARIARVRADAIPADAWNRTHKLALQQMRVATEFEAALSAGLIDEVGRLSAEWKMIEDAIEKDRTENEERRDPLRGLSRQN
jgi:hypothetical protein